jgi:hypothetical protein
MFYYSESAGTKPVARGGANYCFTFEFLEAILNEFGTRVADRQVILDGLKRATSWCRQYRLHYHYGNVQYHGWNSGQQRDSQTLGTPESWATAVIHMFLARLCSVLSQEIRNQLLWSTYNARNISKPTPPMKSGWDRFMDVTIDLMGAPPSSVKKLLKDHMLDPIRATPQHADKLKCCHSALLFGPPGTSKTSIVEAVAEELGWPFLEITPSHFLKRGMERIYERANEIFDDLMDLSKVVILFDEMDALVQRRSGGADAERLDVTRQFLTTSMLPKLAKLHKHARVVFFMATNHQREFDEAIKRPGRFDLLLCMGPPSWTVKAANLDTWLSDKESDPVGVKKQLKQWGQDKDIASMLDRFTFGEMREFFDHLASHYGSLTEYVEKKKKDDFKTLVQQWANHSITLRNVGGVERNLVLDEYEQDKSASKIQPSF